jgi:hypothetical protein
MYDAIIYPNQELRDTPTNFYILGKINYLVYIIYQRHYLLNKLFVYESR